MSPLYRVAFNIFLTCANISMIKDSDSKHQFREIKKRNDCQYDRLSYDIEIFFSLFLDAERNFRVSQIKHVRIRTHEIK